MKLKTGSFSWSQVVKVTVAVVLIYYLYYLGYFDPKSLGALIRTPLLVWGFLLLGLVLFFASWRFYQLALSPISFQNAFRLTLIGIFFNYFIPGGIGGDLVKGVTLNKTSSLSLSQSAYMTLIDRLMGLATMSLLSLVAFFFMPDHLKASPKAQILWWTLIGIWILVSSSLIMILSRRLLNQFLFRVVVKIPLPSLQRLTQRLSWLKTMRRHSLKKLIWASGLSLLSQLSSIGLFILIGQELYPDLPLSWSIYFFVVPIGFILTAIPISPGGIGVGQAAFVFLFNRALNMKTDFGALGVTAFQFYQLLWGLIGAYFFIFLKQTRHYESSSLHS